MKKIITRSFILFCFLMTLAGVKAQPGIPATPYCYPLYSQCPCNQPGPSNAQGNFVNDFIHSVVTLGGNVDINNMNSGCNSQNFPSIGCRNYIYHKCQHNLSVSAGQAITFSIQVGSIFAQGVAVYIDWNNDLTFANPTELVAASPSTIPPGNWGTYTYTVPAAQPNGIYRMRVRCTPYSNGPSINACNNYGGGETEDYDVYVGTTSPQVSAVVSNNSPICAGNTLSLNLTYTSQCSPTYTWFGPAAFTSSAQNPVVVNAMPINSGNYTLSIMCNTVCPVTLVTNVIVTPTNMVANAGPSQTLCAANTITTFSASAPPAGPGTWSIVSGTATIFGLNNPTASAWFAAPTQYTNVFAWTVGAPGCQSTSTMAVTVHTDVANAGASQTVCSQPSIVLNGNMPPNVTGSWSLVSGGGTITSPNSATTNVTSLATGTNVFQWTLVHPVCGTSTSQVTITNYPTPTLSAVANPTSICLGDQGTITASGAYQYFWQPTGSGSVIVVSPTVASTYTIIGNNGPCFGAPITISVGVDPVPSQAVAGPTQTICDYTAYVTANAPSVGTGQWSLVSGSATLANPTSTNCYLSNIGSGANILQWTTTLGNCNSTATTLVQNDALTILIASNTTLICAGDQVTLTATGATNYTWLPTGGNSSVAIVSPTTTTTYTLLCADAVCTTTSSITQSVVVCTGMNAVSLNADKLKIYPNPFKDELKLVSNELVRIKLTDVNGKEILKKDIIGETIINTSQLSKGVYFIHVISSFDVKPIKVIKD